MRDTCFNLSVVLVLAAMFTPSVEAQGPPDPERCRNQSEWRQLDFWIGTWDVIHPEDGRGLGVNVVEPILNDCALMENWTSAGGFIGKSMNFYDSQRRTWRQVWVDGFGSVLDYREGEFRDGAMRFSGITIGPSADTTFRKLTFHHVAADTVRQVFESSEDGGETWAEDWVGLYIRRAAQEIDTLALESHVSLLADDLLEGRAPGTRGERVAALYLISQLRRLGLEPLTDRGYRLPVPLTAVEVDLEKAVVRLSGDGQEQTVRPPAFYHPGGSRRAFRGFSGDLVFAGPAVNALETLTGYEGLAGKVVVLTPPWAGIERVEAELLQRGAVGTVQLVPNESFYDRLRIVRGPTRFFLPDGVDDPANQGHLPVVVGGRAMIRALGIDDEMAGGGAGGPVALERRFELELPFTTEERMGHNVAGVITGADPALRNEWIIYVAHYDHVGYGESTAGDSIWNGFTDNAAGCAMLLEIARVMAADPPPRSVAFLFVTAEEQGLLGSNWFVHDPPVPLHRIRAVLNLDGGAPPAPPAAWGLVGADDSWAGEVARATIEGHGWSVRGVAPGPQSDHWPFHLAEVPALLLFPGDTLDGVTEQEAAVLRERWQREHTPDDEWSPDFPLTGMARYAELALRIGRELATVSLPTLPLER